jgi:cyclopropane fatty-acyl-phospholipid synthase-like methyltransferase
MLTPTTLYWIGNAAKTTIVRDILAHLPDEPETLIFDYGCGAGGDWGRVLRDYPQIQLIGYEPNTRSASQAQTRLRDVNARILTGAELAGLDFKAHVIVSFSVLEHVYDRQGYLQTAKTHLAEDGVFYLNYDDGHFRNVLHLDHPQSWLTDIRIWLHNLTAKPLARLGYISQYQHRVPRTVVDAAVEHAGFRVSQTFYSNLESLKGLCKHIPQDQQAEFARFWLDVEGTLNDRFLAHGTEVYGDSANLWQVMGSRTLVLRHA